MKKPRSWKAFHRILTNSLMAALASLVLGCGGSGGGGGEVAAAGQVGGGGGNITPVVQPQTFLFPSFSINSRLAVIANFQSSAETSSVTGQLSAALSDIGGVVVPRIAQRFDPSAQGDVSPCGYADVCAFDHLTSGPVSRQAAVPSTVRPRFQELPAGSQEDFFLVPGFRSVTAEKILEPGETTHCTIFAEVVNNTPVMTAQRARIIAEAFDSNNPQRPGSGIYDQVRAVFGSEWNQNPPGGNDGDQKIVLMFFSPDTLGEALFGYVSPADSSPNGGSTSNKGEIIYVSSGKSDYQTLATISHEFQHLINQNEKVNQQGLNPPEARAGENIAVNEGLSGLSEEICGYTFESGNQLLVTVTNGYLSQPERHEFFDFFQTGLGYGQGYLFFRYVREHFGDSTIRAISSGTGTGLANLNANLPGGFGEIFRRWTIANYATNLTGAVPSIYRYPSGLRTDGSFAGGTLVGIKTFPMTNGQTSQTANLNAWSAAYLTLENKPGSGLEATVTPASGDSPFGVIFESASGQFTSFDD